MAWRESSELGAPMRRLATVLETIAQQSRSLALATDVGRLAGSVRDYLIPRVEDPSRPCTLVFAGPTGAGKSTLLNSVAGSSVSATGALRPTTRGSVVLTSPSHVETHRVIGGIECEVVVASAPILETVSLVDTPDVDSTEVGHRVVAETLVDHADIVVFVTSALRYADAVPWQLLRRARSRGTDVIVVLNRVSSATSGARVDFRSRLADAGLSDDLVIVPEHHLATGAERVPTVAVRSLRRKLAAVAATREQHARDTLQRVLAATVTQVGGLIGEIEVQAESRDDLEAEIALSLGSDVEHLALTGVTAGLHQEAPEKASARQLARWVRRNRRSSEEIAAAHRRLTQRVTGLLAAELRRWLHRDGPFAAEALEDDFDEALSSAVKGWLEFVQQMAEERHGRTWSEEVALIESACSGRVTAGASALFAAESAVLVDRARRELVGRLHVIASALAAVVADHAYPGLGEIDLEELRVAHGAVVSRLAPVHA